MAIRRLSYRLDEEPDTGAVRLIPAPQGPQEQEKQQSLEPTELAALVLAVGHRQGLSRSRLPGGGSLLCSTAADRTKADRTAAGGASGGLRVDVAYADSPAELPPPLRDVAPESLTAFARAHADRVEPFLADVRRLFDERAGRQIVVAEHEPEAVAHWVALACASLPDAYAASLTFSTWTAKPRRAPQQILGIGPDADFDRFDGPTLDHFYRVHDGVGGQGSTPVPDTWAEVTARQWIEGTPPEPGADDDPFALTGPTFDVRQLAAMSGEARRDIVSAHAASVARESAGSPVVDELYALCRDLGDEDRAAAEPLALALVRHYAAVAEDQGTLPDIAACERLPLSTEAWLSLRGELGGRADDALRRRLREPVRTWTEPLRLALAMGADAGRGLDEAMERLARALLNPGRRECAEAVEVLEALGHTGLNRRVLKLLAQNLTGHKLDRLRDLADAPQGRWLLKHIDDAPLAVRLAEAAARWRREPGGPRGAELFGALTELLPGRRVNDAETLRLLWRLVWGGRQPDRVDVMRLARTCTARLIIEAGFGIRLVGWLKEPDRVDNELVDLARALLAERLGPREQATAELLVLAADFAEMRVPVDRAVDQLIGRMRRASPVHVVLRKGIDELVARGLSRLDPVDLCRSQGLRFLMNAESGLLRQYRARLLDDGVREGLIHALPHQPAHIAALYQAWRPRHGRGVTVEWQRVSDELLSQILAPVMPGLDEWTLSQVATELARLAHGRGQQRVQEWNAWRNRLTEAQGPPKPQGPPGSCPGHDCGHPAP
ncbi:GTPase-associated protein 1-related protein [Streptomyces sp. NPDC002855]|uniref:GTPase-associated protein 1-related protein n=1 Tax=Streptomyces sp. NPDC002855 TaxID=3154437 RepID=UPI00333355AD